MNALCLNCNKELSWWKLRNEFNCPHCDKPLSANTSRSFIGLIVVWILADIPVKLFFYATLGTDSFIANFARAIVSGAVGCVLAYIILGRFSTISVRHVS